MWLNKNVYTLYPHKRLAYVKCSPYKDVYVWKGNAFFKHLQLTSTTDYSSAASSPYLTVSTLPAFVGFGINRFHTTSEEGSGKQK